MLKDGAEHTHPPLTYTRTGMHAHAHEGGWRRESKELYVRQEESIEKEQERVI